MEIRKRHRAVAGQHAVDAGLAVAVGEAGMLAAIAGDDLPAHELRRFAVEIDDLECHPAIRIVIAAGARTGARSTAACAATTAAAATTATTTATTAAATTATATA